MKLPTLKKIPPLPTLNISQFLGLVHRSKNVIFALGAILVIVLNVLLVPLSLRLDFSKNQAHTLSPSSKKIVKNLQQTTRLIFYQSADLPTQLQPIKQDVQDLLKEYQREGKGKIVVEVKDPKTDEKALSEATQAGIGELRFSQREQSSFNVSTGYFGLVAKVGEQVRPIPQLSDLSNLEYNITSAIHSLVRPETPKIAVVGSTPAFAMQGGDPLGIVKQILGQQYTIEPLEFSSAAPSQASPAEETADIPLPTPDSRKIDLSIKTILLVTDQNKQYTDQDIARLNDYIKDKGNVIAFIDGIGINEQTLATEEAKHNLYKFTEAYGITINRDLVLSATAELVNFGDQVQSLLLPYPYWFKASNFNATSGFFSNVNYITYPWSSSLTLKDAPGFTVQNIIQTDSRSWRETGPFVLNPQQITAIEPQSFATYTVGAVSTVKDGGKLMVIPSSRFPQAQYLSPESGNMNFLLNAVNDYASEGALSGIRQRIVQIYQLPTLSNNMKEVFKYINMFLLPAFFALGGGIYLMKRR